MFSMGCFRFVSFSLNDPGHDHDYIFEDEVDYVVMIMVVMVVSLAHWKGDHMV